MFRHTLRYLFSFVFILAFAACQGAVPTASPTVIIGQAVATAAPTPLGATPPPTIPRPTSAPPPTSISSPTGATTASATPAPATAAPTEAPPTPTETLVPGQTELIVVTHDSFAASEDVVQEFEQANNAKVRILKSGDAGAALNKEILAGTNNPLGDAFFGVDNTFLSRALKANIFEAYKPAGLAQIPNQFRLDPQSRLTPTDYGDVCLNYDIGWFKQKNLAPPQTLDDLAKPQYKSLLIVENPATSSPGLAFLLSTIAHFGQDKYLDYWKQLRANDVAVSEGWDDAFNNRFTLSGNGDRPIVVSYGTDPGAEVFFSNGKLTEPPNAVIATDQSCFRQIEFVGVLKGAKHPDLARKWVDFMLSKSFQQDIPGQMFIFPVMPNTLLPDWFKFAVQSKTPAQLSPDQIDANREKWINAWTQTVLR